MLTYAGEYFDTNKDLLTSWIRDSRKTSSLFDFGMRRVTSPKTQALTYADVC
jgi:hypothetical protein